MPMILWLNFCCLRVVLVRFLNNPEKLKGGDRGQSPEIQHESLSPPRGAPEVWRRVQTKRSGEKKSPLGQFAALGETLRDPSETRPASKRSSGGGKEKQNAEMAAQGRHENIRLSQRLASGPSDETQTSCKGKLTAGDVPAKLKCAEIDEAKRGHVMIQGAPVKMNRVKLFFNSFTLFYLKRTT